MNKFVYWLRTGSNIQKKDKFPLRLRRKKVATFFTWIGLFHWFLLSLFAAASANYNNNLSIAFVCFLGALYFMGIISNYYVLKNTTVRSLKIESSEEGQAFDLTLTIDAKKDDPNIWMEIDNTPAIFAEKNQELSSTLSFISGSWGVFSAPIFSLHTLWPYGLNKAWIFLNPDVKFVVLPPDLSNDTFKGSDSGVLENSLLTSSSYGDPDTLRPLMHLEQGKIAWKDSIRRQKWMTYTYTASSEKVITVTWPDDDKDPRGKFVLIKNTLDIAVKEGHKFQVIHPLFSSKVVSGKESELDILSELAFLEIKTAPWEDLVKSVIVSQEPVENLESSNILSKEIFS